tara:strand:+ start:1051 stop:1875 length:825 start_codon:yes stop_codon:yes gene_type:complete
LKDFKKRVQNSFNRKASSYDEYAILQKEVSRRMSEKLNMIKTQPKKILDLGCGTGFLTEELSKNYPNTDIISVDFSESMLKICRDKFKNCKVICADIDHLPLAPSKFDLIISSLTFHWCDDIYKIFQQAYNLLSNNGNLIFSSIGPDTLFELNNAMKKIDNQDHVNHFIDMHHYGDALLEIGFNDPVVDNEKITIEYEEFKDVLKSIKNIGANVLDDKNSRYLTRKDFKLIEHNYKRNEESNYPVTYEVLYGVSWKKPPMNPINNRDVIPIKTS